MPHFHWKSFNIDIHVIRQFTTADFCLLCVVNMDEHSAYISEYNWEIYTLLLKAWVNVLDTEPGT